MHRLDTFTSLDSSMNNLFELSHCCQMFAATAAAAVADLFVESNDGLNQIDLPRLKFPRH